VLLQSRAVLPPPAPSRSHAGRPQIVSFIIWVLFLDFVLFVERRCGRCGAVSLLAGFFAPETMLIASSSRPGHALRDAFFLYPARYLRPRDKCCSAPAVVPPNKLYLSYFYTSIQMTSRQFPVVFPTSGQEAGFFVRRFRPSSFLHSRAAWRPLSSFRFFFFSFSSFSIQYGSAFDPSLALPLGKFFRTFSLGDVFLLLSSIGFVLGYD